MNGGFLDQSRPCDDLLVTPADVVPRFWESAEVCLDQCYLPSKWEVFWWVKRRLFWWKLGEGGCTENLWLGFWCLGMRSALYWTTKIAKKAGRFLSPLRYMPISDIYNYIYTYLYRSVYTCICGIPLDIEMKLVKFILVIHLCYLHSVFFSGRHLFFVGSPHWNQSPFQTCENPTARRRGGRRGLIFAKKDTTTGGTHGDIAVSSDDFRGILWHESAYIAVCFECSVLVTLMIGWTNAIAIKETPGMPTGSSRWRRSKGSGSGFTFCSDVNIGIAASMGFAEVRHVFFWKPRIHLYAQGCPYCRTWFTTPFNKNLASDSCRKKECVEFVFFCAGIVFHNFGTSNLIMAFLYLSYYVLPEAHESHRFCPCEDYGIGSNPFSLSMADLLPDDLATMILVNQRQRFIDLSGPLFRSKGRKKHGKKLDPKHLKIICRWFAWMRVITCPINSNVLQVGLGWVRVRVGIRRPWIFLQVEALPSTWPVLKVGAICVEGKGINECPPPKKGNSGVNTSYIMAWRWTFCRNSCGWDIQTFWGKPPPCVEQLASKTAGEDLGEPLLADLYGSLLRMELKGINDFPGQIWAQWFKGSQKVNLLDE